MTDLRDQFARLLEGEPAAPDDIERIVGAGRRARRRRTMAMAAAGTVGAAGLTAAVVVPVLASPGNEASITVGVQPTSTPTPSPSAAQGSCYFLSAPAAQAKRDLARLIRSGKVGTQPSITQVRSSKHGSKAVLEVCSQDTTTQGVTPRPSAATQISAGPPYHYTEQPDAIASRLGAHLHDRVTGFGLTISYVRPFAQESTTPEKGHPSYFGGNVDVHETSGYGDIGVQVTHATTTQVPFDGSCTAAEHCTETTLPDGSVLRTGEVQAGPGDTVRTAEVHRPDGVVVQAQESNYPFGPDAGTQAHGDQPISVDQLVSLAEDPDFTF